jgi:hypothetical protein
MVGDSCKKKSSLLLLKLYVFSVLPLMETMASHVSREFEIDGCLLAVIKDSSG